MVYYAVSRTKFDMLEDSEKARQMLRESDDFGEMVRLHR